MSVQLWTYIFVGITFSLYIGIAIWSKASSTSEFYVAKGTVNPLTNGMERLQTGCQRLVFYLWLALFHSWGMMALCI